MKKILSVMFMLILALCLSATAFGGEISGQAAWYCGEYGDNILWTLDDDGTLTLNGWGNMANYTRGEPAPWYDFKDMITKLVFEGNINSIGDYAFTDCSNITGTLKLPEELLTIGTFAFQNCSGLTGNLVIQKSVETIDNSAFQNCSGFDGELVISESVGRIGHYAFYGCSNLEKDAVIPYGVDYIGNYAFKNCGVDNFFFYTEAPQLEEGFEERPPFDKEIDTIYRFKDMNGWETGEGKMWYGYTLKENTRNIASGYCGAEGDGTNLQWVLDPEGTIIISGEGPMANYTQAYEAPWMDYSWYIYDVVIEEGVTTIGNYAFTFANLHNEPLFLPSTLESIGDYAFNYCSSVWGSLVIPENVKNIGQYAFQGCKYLDSLVLPEGLTAIGNGAFKGCKDMGGSVVIPSTVWMIGDEAFADCGVSEFFIYETAAFKEVSAEGAAFDAGDMFHLQTEDEITSYKDCSADNLGKDEIIASGNCGAEGEQIDVQWSLTASGKLTISGSGRMRDFEEKYIDYLGWATTAPWVDFISKITSIVIEEGVKYIGDYAFYPFDHASNELILPESLEGIGDFAFNGCNNLRGELKFPENLKSIGEWAFAYCFAFTGDLVIPDSVETIGEGAFGYCRGFEGKIVLPKNLGVIESYVFTNCYNFTGNLVIPESVTSIGNEAFNACRRLTGDLIIPDNVITIGEKAFNECFDFEGKLVIGSKVETIGEDAFEFCRGLTGDLIIPDSVTNLGAFAFEDCIGFDGKLVIGKGIENLKQNVFYNCENIEDEVIIPANIKYINYGAFNNCGGKYYIFEGDAPELVYEANCGDDSFDVDYDYISFPEGNTTFVIEDNKWMGYNIGYGAEEKVVYGDVDGNGKINVMDANLVRRATAKLVTLDENQVKAADVDGNGKINIMDANYVRRYTAKLVDSFPAEG